MGIIKLKRNLDRGVVPQLSDLEYGELALNVYDGKIYQKQDRQDGSGPIIVDLTEVPHPQYELLSDITAGDPANIVDDAGTPKLEIAKTIGSELYTAGVGGLFGVPNLVEETSNIASGGGFSLYIFHDFPNAWQIIAGETGRDGVDWGTTITALGDDNSEDFNINITYDEINDQFICFYHSGGNYWTRVRTVKVIDKDTVILGNEVIGFQYPSWTNDESGLTHDKVNNIVVVANWDGNNSEAYAEVFKINGANDITYGGSQLMPVTNNDNGVGYDSTTGKYLWCSEGIEYVTFTVNPATLAVENLSPVYAGNEIGRSPFLSYDPVAQRFLVTYDEYDGSYYGTACVVVDTNGATPVIGNTYWLTASTDPSWPTDVYFSSNQSAADPINGGVYVINQDTFSALKTVSFWKIGINPATNEASASFYTEVTSDLGLVGEDNGKDKGCFITYDHTFKLILFGACAEPDQPFWTKYDLPFEIKDYYHCDGIIQEDGLIGDVRRFAPRGSVSKVHTGLTLGADYFFDKNIGAITATDTSARIGKALNDTDLYLYENPIDVPLFERDLGVKAEPADPTILKESDIGDSLQERYITVKAGDNLVEGDLVSLGQNPTNNYTSLAYKLAGPLGWASPQKYWQANEGTYGNWSINAQWSSLGNEVIMGMSGMDVNNLALVSMIWDGNDYIDYSYDMTPVTGTVYDVKSFTNLQGTARRTALFWKNNSNNRFSYKFANWGGESWVPSTGEVFPFGGDISSAQEASVILPIGQAFGAGGEFFQFSSVVNSPAYYDIEVTENDPAAMAGKWMRTPTPNEDLYLWYSYLALAVAEEIRIDVPADGAASITSGDYITVEWAMHKPSTRSYIWFNVDGAGGNPSLPYYQDFNLEVAVNSTDDQATVAQKIYNVIWEDPFGGFSPVTVDATGVDFTILPQGYSGDTVDTAIGQGLPGFAVTITTQGSYNAQPEITQINIPAGGAAAIVPGEWFSLEHRNDANSQRYYYWFEVDGSTGNDPAPGGHTGGYQINVLSTDDQTALSEKVWSAVNDVGWGDQANRGTHVIYAQQESDFGPCTDAYIGLGLTGFSISVTNQGAEAVVAGTDPGLAGNAYEVALNSSHSSASQIASQTFSTMMSIDDFDSGNGYWMVSEGYPRFVIVPMGWTLFPWRYDIAATPDAGTAGHIFNFIPFSAPGNNYYIWFRIDGTLGTDPAIPGATGIMVDILSTDGDSEICDKVAAEVQNNQSVHGIVNVYHGGTEGTITILQRFSGDTADPVLGFAPGFSITTDTEGVDPVVAEYDINVWHKENAGAAWGAYDSNSIIDPTNGEVLWVWYTMEGSGTSDASTVFSGFPGTVTEVQVDILLTDTPFTVATKTAAAITSQASHWGVSEIGGVITLTWPNAGGSNTGVQDYDFWAGGGDPVRFSRFNFATTPGSDAVEEQTEVTWPTTGASLTGGDYFTFNTPGNNYYLWVQELVTPAAAEITDVDFNAESSINGSDYWLINSPTVGYYIWYRIFEAPQYEEVQVQINTVPSVAGQFFVVPAANTIYSEAAVYYEIDGSTGNNPGGFSVEIPVDILSTDPPAAVAAKTVSAIQTSGYFGVPDNPVNIFSDAIDAGGGLFTYTLANAGPEADPIDGPLYIGGDFTPSVTTQGSAGTNDGTDPGIAPQLIGKTGIQVDIAPGDTAAQVGDKTAAAVNILADFSSPTTGTGTITFTNTVAGAADDAATGNGIPTASITVTQQGANEVTDGTDPGLAGTGIMYQYQDAWAGGDMADDTATLINALPDVNASFTLSTVTITNTVGGAVVDAGQNASSWLISITQQGVDATTEQGTITVPGSDYAIQPGESFSIYNPGSAISFRYVVDGNDGGNTTGDPIAIASTDNLNAIASATQVVINNHTDFDATVSGNVVSVTNVYQGGNEGYFSPGMGNWFTSIVTQAGLYASAEEKIVDLPSNYGIDAGDYFTMDDRTNKWYVWYSVQESLGTYETGEVIFPPSSWNPFNPDYMPIFGGDYFLMSSPSTDYYIWYEIREWNWEITEITFPDASAITPGDYWFYHETSVTEIDINYSDYTMAYGNDQAYEIWYQEETPLTGDVYNCVFSQGGAGIASEQYFALRGPGAAGRGSDLQVFWYSVDGGGSLSNVQATAENDFNLINYGWRYDVTYHKVDILSTDDAPTVASKTNTIVDAVAGYTSVLGINDITITYPDGQNGYWPNYNVSGFTRTQVSPGTSSYVGNPPEIYTSIVVHYRVGDSAANIARKTLYGFYNWNSWEYGWDGAATASIRADRPGLPATLPGPGVGLTGISFNRANEGAADPTTVGVDPEIPGKTGIKVVFDNHWAGDEGFITGDFISYVTDDIIAAGGGKQEIEFDLNSAYYDIANNLHVPYRIPEPGQCTNPSVGLGISGLAFGSIVDGTDPVGRVGTDPAPVGYRRIGVDLLDTDDVPTITQKTWDALIAKINYNTGDSEYGTEPGSEYIYIVNNSFGMVEITKDGLSPNETNFGFIQATIGVNSQSIITTVPNSDQHNMDYIQDGSDSGYVAYLTQNNSDYLFLAVGKVDFLVQNIIWGDIIQVKNTDYWYYEQSSSRYHDIGITQNYVMITFYETNYSGDERTYIFKRYDTPNRPGVKNQLFPGNSPSSYDPADHIYSDKDGSLYYRNIAIAGNPYSDEFVQLITYYSGTRPHIKARTFTVNPVTDEVTVGEWFEMPDNYVTPGYLSYQYSADITYNKDLEVYQVAYFENVDNDYILYAELTTSNGEIIWSDKGNAIGDTENSGNYVSKPTYDNNRGMRLVTATYGPYSLPYMSDVRSDIYVDRRPYFAGVAANDAAALEDVNIIRNHNLVDWPGEILNLNQGTKLYLDGNGGLTTTFTEYELGYIVDQNQYMMDFKFDPTVRTYTVGVGGISGNQGVRLIQDPATDEYSIVRLVESNSFPTAIDSPDHVSGLLTGYSPNYQYSWLAKHPSNGKILYWSTPNTTADVTFRIGWADENGVQTGPVYSLPKTGGIYFNRQWSLAYVHEKTGNVIFMYSNATNSTRYVVLDVDWDTGTINGVLGSDQVLLDTYLSAATVYPVNGKDNNFIMIMRANGTANHGGNNYGVITRATYDPNTYTVTFDAWQRGVNTYSNYFTATEISYNPDLDRYIMLAVTSTSRIYYRTFDVDGGVLTLHNNETYLSGYYSDWVRAVWYDGRYIVTYDNGSYYMYYMALKEHDTDINGFMTRTTASLTHTRVRDLGTSYIMKHDLFIKPSDGSIWVIHPDYYTPYGIVSYKLKFQDANNMNYNGYEFKGNASMNGGASQFIYNFGANADPAGYVICACSTDDVSMASINIDDLGWADHSEDALGISVGSSGQGGSVSVVLDGGLKAYTNYLTQEPDLSRTYWFDTDNNGGITNSEKGNKTKAAIVVDSNAIMVDIDTNDLDGGSY